MMMRRRNTRNIWNRKSIESSIKAINPKESDIPIVAPSDHIDHRQNNHSDDNKDDHIEPTIEDVAVQMMKRNKPQFLPYQMLSNQNRLPNQFNGYQQYSFFDVMKNSYFWMKDEK